MSLSPRARFGIKSAVGSRDVAAEIADAIDARPTVEYKDLEDNEVTESKIADKSVSSRHYQKESIFMEKK